MDSRRLFVARQPNRKALYLTAPLVTAPAPPTIPPPPPVDALTTRLIAQHGTVENALRALVTASITTETTISDLTRQVNDYKARLPEGSIVLPRGEAETFAKLKALGTPDEIEKAFKKLPTVEGELSKRDREKLAREGALAAGLDADGFTALVGREGLAIEMRDVSVTEKGKTVTKKLPFLRPAADEKAPFVAATDYVAKLPAHDQRALAAAPPTPTGTPAHSQGPTPVGGNPADIVGDYIGKRNAPRQPAAAAS